MSLARHFVALSIVLSALLAACGGADSATVETAAKPSAELSRDPSKRTQSDDGLDFSNAPEHIAKLIPASTAIYIQLRSFAGFDSLLTRLARASSSFGRQLDELRRTMHRLVPGDERHVMRDQPVGIAITFPQDRGPELTFVLPLRDVLSYKRSLQVYAHMPTPVFDGSYLAVTASNQYERPREPVALALGLADHPLSARIDLARLDRRYGSQLRLALTALASGENAHQIPFLPGDPQLTTWLQELADPLLYALAVGRQMEVSVEVGDDQMRVDCSVETRDAGVLAGWTSSEPVDLTPFARSLVASDTISFLGGCDPSVLTDRLAALISETGPERERVSQILESFASQFGSLGALSGSLTTGESHLALHVHASDDPAFARNLASTLELFSRSGLGVAVQSKNTISFEGVEVQDLQVHFDAASMCMLTGERTDDLPAVQARLDNVARALFGDETVRLRIAKFEDRGLIAIGNDEAWFRRTLLWAKEDKDLTPPDVRAALEHLGSARAAAIVRLDLARWMQDLDDWKLQWRGISGPVRILGAPGETTMHTLEPQPLTLHLGADGRTLRIGLSLGLAVEATSNMARR